MPTLIPNEQRFWSKVKKTETCWLWTGGVDKDGYGKFQVTLPKPTNSKITTQRHVRAHRYAFELKFGKPPRSGLLHECDVKACVRVHRSHVQEGTQSRNIRDSLRRGRVQCRMTPDLVMVIRREVLRGRGVMARIRAAAERHNVSAISVQWIVYGVTWSWVK
jgi:hypothetical protein